MTTAPCKRSLIEASELGTTPFTEAERAAIARYAEKACGIPGWAAGNDITLPCRDSFPGIREAMRADLRLLNRWDDAIGNLRWELGVIKNPEMAGVDAVAPPSTAGLRYIGHELTRCRAALDRWRQGVCEHYLGCTGSGLAPSGYPPRRRRVLVQLTP